MSTVDTNQDFLCKLGMKPHMDLKEISIFSQYHVIVRHTIIIKDLCRASTYKNTIPAAPAMPGLGKTTIKVWHAAATTAIVFYFAKSR